MKEKSNSQKIAEIAGHFVGRVLLLLIIALLVKLGYNTVAYHYNLPEFTYLESAYIILGINALKVLVTKKEKGE